MARVRRETREQHQQLESILPIARENFTLAEYQFVLEKFFGIYTPLEAGISAFAALPEALQWESRKKTITLENDLADLGLTQKSIMALPMAHVATMSTLPEILGTMYVLEGATLGGQFISRAVSQRFGFDQRKGCRFFSSYGPEVGSMWRCFGEVVRQQMNSSDDADRFVAYATLTFSTFAQWLKGDSHT
jgi:heme oxygenase (biliverdin-IX-beta and delta-forming)